MDGPPSGHDAVLATAVRLVDLGCFRLGADEYADDNGSYGLTTLERRHVRRETGEAVFCFVGKSGVEQEVHVDDKRVLRVLDVITRGRRPRSRLLATREQGRWRPGRRRQRSTTVSATSSGWR